MKLWIKLQHWFYRALIDYKTKKIVEFNKERENYLKTNNMKLWIARCESGHLQLFEYRPTYNGKMWVNGWTSSIPLDDNKNSFPEVTFENSPQQVEIKLVDNM